MAGSARKISTCFPLTETYHELRSMFTSSIDKRLACKWVLIKLRISSCRKLSFINCRKEQKPVLKWGNEIITRQSSRSCPRVCLRSQSYIPPVVCGLQSLDRHARTLAETHQLSLLCNCLPLSPFIPLTPRLAVGERATVSGIDKNVCDYDNLLFFFLFFLKICIKVNFFWKWS